MKLIMNNSFNLKKKKNYLLYNKYNNIFLNNNNIIILHNNIVNTKKLQLLYSLLKKKNISINKIKLNFIKNRFLDKKLNPLFKGGNIVFSFHSNLVENLFYIQQLNNVVPLSLIHKNIIINYKYIMNLLLVISKYKIKTDLQYKIFILNNIFTVQKHIFFLIYPCFNLIHQFKYYGNIKSTNKIL